MRHLVLGLAALALGVFAAGCSSDGGGGGGTDSGELAIEFFRAEPETIAPGGKTTLSWKTRNATSIRVFDGTNERIAQTTDNEGSVEASPAETMSFRLLAQNASGDSKEETVMVVVKEPTGPSLSFTSTQARVDLDSSTFLRWDTTGAARVVVRIAGGEVLVDTERPADAGKLSGDLEIAPVHTTVYEATATDEEGTSTTESLEIIVDPLVTEFGSDLSHPIPIGTEVTLTWSTRGADEVEITTPEGESYTAPEAMRDSGTTTMIAGESGIFTLKATRGKGEKIREYKAQMRELPTVVTLEVSPDVINAGQPTPVTITWEVANADTVEIATAGGSVIVPETVELAGSETFTASAETTLVLTATNLAGDTTREIVVRAVPLPAIQSFVATPNRVTPFGTTRLSWVTANAASLTLEQIDHFGEVIEHAIPQDDEGMYEINLASRSTFRLVAENEAGTTVEASAVVEIGPPVIDSFEGAELRFGTSDPIVLEWIGRGGRSAKVFSIERDDDGEIVDSTLECELTFPEVVSSGTCATAAQTTFGHYEFQLVLEDGSFSATAFATALVSNGPVIRRFEVSPDLIDEGDSTTIVWTVDEDAAGNAPELTLKVNGAEVNVSEMTNSPKDGSATLDFDAAGVFRLELVATSDGGSTFADEASATLTVVGLPSIDAFTATPDAVDAGDPVTLEWTMTNVSRASIRNETAGNVIYDIPAHALASGSRTVSASIAPSVTYKLIAYNLNNVMVEEEVTVAVTQSAAQIVDFDVPATANAGDSINVAWTTTGGTNVRLTPVMGPASLLTGVPFEDISTTGTPVTMADCGGWMGPLDDGCATITFANGFTFPFDGQHRTALDVYVDGFISFDVGADLAANDPANFPSTPGIHLAPFWSGLTIDAGGAAPAGAVHYEQKTGPRGDYLVIQWTNARNSPMGLGWLSATDDVDLNFQVVLWDNGAVEFRYGAMSAPIQTEAAGEHAVIGFQDGAAANYDLLSGTGLMVSGGLAHRSWGYFEESHPLSGLQPFTVTRTTIFTLCLDHAGGVICEDRTVTVN